MRHTKSYKLQWLNDSDEIKVKKYMLVHFEIANMKMKYYAMWFQCKQDTCY